MPLATTTYSPCALSSEPAGGCFTGEENPFPYGPYGRLDADSTGGPRRYPNVGLDPFGEGGQPRVSMFGTPIEPTQMEYDPTPEERTLNSSGDYSSG